MLTLGIAATVADADHAIDKFIRYHLNIGFSIIFIFVDDNCRKTIEIAENYPQVKVFERSKALFDLWQKVPFYDKNKELKDHEVMVRQELNFHVAWTLASREGVDWLLHIDLDELYFPNGCDLQTHFSEMQLNNFRAITYLNYESIVENTNSNCMYESVRYFKVNYFKNKHWFFSNAQQRYIQENEWLSDKFFRFYQNGKSCVSCYGQQIEVFDVHSIVGDGRRRMGTRESPLILHFPCSTFYDFCRKYRRLGDFGDNWRGVKRVGDYIDGVHLEARDLFNSGATEMEIMNFYQRYFVIPEEKIAQLIDLNLAVEIDWHKRKLEIA